MINYKQLQLYCILLLSVYFQSYLNLYDKYFEYKERTEYLKRIHLIGKTKHNSDNNLYFTTYYKPSENYYIPKQAQFIRWYLNKSPIDSFRLSPSILGAFNRYAILEGAYPIQVSEQSHYLITTTIEKLPLGCKVVTSNEGIRIVYCP